MSKTTERRTVITLDEKITRVNICEGGTSVEIFSVSECGDNQEEATVDEVKKAEVEYTQEYIEKYFPVVKASTLSLEDMFLKYEPESGRQSWFKAKLIETIESGLIDFRVQSMDPAVNETGEIYYEAGRKVAIGESLKWWKKKAEEFMPEKSSRLGTVKERIAFLGVFIKYLIEKQGYDVSEAWRAVCDDSKYLGHYCNSKNATNHEFEPTGSRKVGLWSDLGNAYKIIMDDGLHFLLIGGDCDSASDECPLAEIFRIVNSDIDSIDATGWIVLSV